MDLVDHQSLYETEQWIMDVEYRLKKQMDEQQYHASSYNGLRRVKHALYKTLDMIGNFLISLRQYKSQAHKAKRPKTSRWSTSTSPPASNKPVEYLESESMIDSNEQ